MSDSIEVGGSNEYQSFKDFLQFLNRKRNEIGKGVSLYLDKGKYLSYRFNEPGTSKRKSKPANESLTEAGVIRAVEKGNKIVELLKECESTSQFWERYETEIEGQVETINDIKTYREIFEDIEFEFWNTPNKQTKRKRMKNLASDIASFNAYYGERLKLFKNIDKIPSWQDFEVVLSNYKQGTKSFKDTYFVLKNIANRCHNSENLLAKLDRINYRQTVRAERQSISLEEYLQWRDKVYSDAIVAQRKIHAAARLKWLWVTDMVGLYGIRPSELAAALNLDKRYEKDGVIVKAINDESNIEMLLVLGDFTYFGTSIKTGNRVCKPVTTDSELINKLNIRNINLPIYKPREGTKASSIVQGFNTQHRNRLISMKAPITQVYALRHLYNQLGEQYGIPQEIRARSMGHSTSTNDTVYKRRSNLQTTVDILTNNNKQPLSLELAKQKLKVIDIDIDDELIKTVLSVIYQLC